MVVWCYIFRLTGDGDDDDDDDHGGDGGGCYWWCCCVTYLGSAQVTHTVSYPRMLVKLARAAFIQQ